MKGRVVAGTILGAMMGLTVHAGVCDRVDMKWLNRHVPVPPARIVSKKEVKGLCEVILEMKRGGELVPVYAGRDFVIAGEMFSNRKQLTQRSLAEVKRERFAKYRKQLDGAVAFVYRPEGKVEHVIYMFTDPVCPFCRKAESWIREVADRYHAEVKFVFFPVHYPVGDQKAVEAICRKASAEEYLDGRWREKPFDKKYDCKEGWDRVQRGKELAMKLGVRGTPTFFVDDGKVVPGANRRLLELKLGGGK